MTRVVRVLKWLLSKLVEADPRLSHALALVKWAEVEFEGKSGERKRAQVLSKLAHAYPDARLRDLAFLIEQAVQEL